MSLIPQIPRQYSLVKFVGDNNVEEKSAHLPFNNNKVYVFFGEITNMKGHCIVSDHEIGKIYSGYHVDNFVEISEDEL